MAKMEFIKDPSKDKNKFKDIKKTSLSEPQSTFNLDEFSESNSSSTNTSKQGATQKSVGRPPKNKVYGTLRTQKINVHRINALQNTLGFETQDDIINNLLNTMQHALEPEQKIMFDMYMKTYIGRDKKLNQ
ncbi:Replication-associated protein RepC [Vagococcus salmoninarum]|uniref:Replication-associated protein RepC n=1 Tax=Vagococcus salmoninarum TaxID=2739 RepID=UPI0028D26B45|nr:Replication-associated protein RepC [Vagococcus salmoninarum]